MDTYHKPMVSWLKEFALPDGYKPFDPDYAIRLADQLRAEGTADIPKDPEQVRDLLGVGWWNMIPDEAAKLLKSVGFKKAGDKWQTPEGKPWTISILAPLISKWNRSASLLQSLTRGPRSVLTPR